MRLFELKQQAPFDPLILEFWEGLDDYTRRFYLIQNNCHSASQAFNRFLEKKGIMNGEVVRIGLFANGQKKYGWFKADLPDTHVDALTNDDKVAMKAQGLNPRMKADRIAYINSSPELYEEFCMIPHSWVEVKGKIYDPSAFYIDGKSGQFDKFVRDKTNLSSRYFYF